MTFKEYCKKYDEIKIKYDIIVLSELIKLYREYKKEEFSSRIIYNELHDYINYSEKQVNYIITKAEELSKEQSEK